MPSVSINLSWCTNWVLPTLTKDLSAGDVQVSQLIQNRINPICKDVMIPYLNIAVYMVVAYLLCWLEAIFGKENTVMQLIRESYYFPSLDPCCLNRNGPAELIVISLMLLTCCWSYIMLLHRCAVTHHRPTEKLSMLPCWCVCGLGQVAVAIFLGAAILCSLAANAQNIYYHKMLDPQYIFPVTQEEFEMVHQYTCLLFAPCMVAATLVHRATIVYHQYTCLSNFAAGYKLSNCKILREIFTFMVVMELQFCLAMFYLRNNYFVPIILLSLGTAFFKVLYT